MRCAGATRSTRSRHRAQTTPPRCHAKRRTRAMTSSLPSAATARSTRPRTGSPGRAPRCRFCRAARPTSIAACSGSPTRSSTPPSTSCAWPTTGSPAASTWAWSTGGTSPSRRGSGWMRASSSASTPTPTARRSSESGTSPGRAALGPFDTSPYRRAKFGEGYFPWAALDIFPRRYLFDPPLIDVGCDDQTVRGVTLIVQNAHPYTYFNRRPIEIAEGAELDSGTLAGAVLRRASPLDMPTVIWRALTKRPRIVEHRQVTAFAGVTELEGSSPAGGPIPLQVDGDYIGDVDRARFGVAAGALLVV